MKPFPSGLGVALVTPFKTSGEIDYDSLDTLVNYVVDNGADYLVALGTTAETPALFPEERKRILSFIKESNHRRVPVVAGIGGNNTAAVVNSLRDFDLDGVEAVLSVTPFYNRPSQRGLYEHFRAVADASPVPVILYNIPGRTGVNMLPETTLRLATDSGNIIAVKEASGNMAQVEELLASRPAGFKVLSGDDGLAIPLIEAGGDGLISVAANAYPAVVSAMVKRAMEGDRTEARRYWNRMEEIVKCLFSEGNPTGVKAALSLKGIIANRLRLPLVEATPQLVDRIERLTQECGL